MDSLTQSARPSRHHDYTPGASLHSKWSSGQGVSRTQWTPEQRFMALAVYADTGSTSEAMALTGIPHNTIHSWISSAEGEAEIASLRQAIRAKVGHIYAAIAVKAATQVMGILDRGEERLTKDGTVMLMQPSLRDMTMTCAVFTDKHAMITGMLDKERAVDAGLSRIAGELMAKLAKLVPATPEPTPVATPAPASSSSPYLG